MLTLRRVTLLLLLCCIGFGLQAQRYSLEVSNPGNGRHQYIHTGDKLYFTDRNGDFHHDGKIEAINDRTLVIDGENWSLDSINIEGWNKPGRAAAGKATGFIGNVLMIAGRITIEFSGDCFSSSEKNGWAAGVPVFLAGASVWVTGAVLNLVVSPVLLTTQDINVKAGSTIAPVTDNKKVASGDDVYGK